ncbi:hypothetical protein ACFQ7B_40400 [Streptomyces erythrochromogenes]|uniref:hypothetical protein n=1 Tax=Streptomyces erythrochromogenes TaxID=285574 RepID=UPI0036B04A34
MSNQNLKTWGSNSLPFAEAAPVTPQHITDTETDNNPYTSLTGIALSLWNAPLPFPDPLRFAAADAAPLLDSARVRLRRALGDIDPELRPLYDAITNDNVIKPKIQNPAGQCEALMKPVGDRMRELGFTEIKYRGMAISSQNGFIAQEGVDNHFVVLGKKDGRTVVVDPSAGQFRKLGFEGPHIVTEDVWRQDWTQAAGNGRYIRYQDFPDAAPAARTFGAAVDLNPGIDMPEATDLTKPGWVEAGRSPEQVKARADLAKKLEADKEAKRLLQQEAWKGYQAANCKPGGRAKRSTDCIPDTARTKNHPKPRKNAHLAPKTASLAKTARLAPKTARLAKTANSASKYASLGAKYARLGTKLGRLGVKGAKNVPVLGWALDLFLFFDTVKGGDFQKWMEKGLGKIIERAYLCISDRDALFPPIRNARFLQNAVRGYGAGEVAGTVDEISRQDSTMDWYKIWQDVRALESLHIPTVGDDVVWGSNYAAFGNSDGKIARDYKQFVLLMFKYPDESAQSVITALSKHELKIQAKEQLKHAQEDMRALGNMGVSSATSALNSEYALFRNHVTQDTLGAINRLVAKDLNPVGIGNLLKFSYPPEDSELIKKFLARQGEGGPNSRRQAAKDALKEFQPSPSGGHRALDAAEMRQIVGALEDEGYVLTPEDGEKISNAMEIDRMVRDQRFSQLADLENPGAALARIGRTDMRRIENTQDSTVLGNAIIGCLNEQEGRGYEGFDFQRMREIIERLQTDPQAALTPEEFTLLNKAVEITIMTARGTGRWNLTNRGLSAAADEDLAKASPPDTGEGQDIAENILKGVRDLNPVEGLKDLMLDIAEESLSEEAYAKLLSTASQSNSPIRDAARIRIPPTPPSGKSLVRKAAADAHTVTGYAGFSEMVDAIDKIGTDAYDQDAFDRTGQALKFYMLSHFGDYRGIIGDSKLLILRTAQANIEEAGGTAGIIASLKKAESASSLFSLPLGAIRKVAAIDADLRPGSDNLNNLVINKKLLRLVNYGIALHKMISANPLQWETLVAAELPKVNSGISGTPPRLKSEMLEAAFGGIVITLSYLDADREPGSDMEPDDIAAYYIAADSPMAEEVKSLARLVVDVKAGRKSASTVSFTKEDEDVLTDAAKGYALFNSIPSVVPQEATSSADGTTAQAVRATAPAATAEVEEIVLDGEQDAAAPTLTDLTTTAESPVVSATTTTPEAKEIVLDSDRQVEATGLPPAAEVGIVDDGGLTITVGVSAERTVSESTTISAATEFVDYAQAAGNAVEAAGGFHGVETALDRLFDYGHHGKAGVKKSQDAVAAFRRGEDLSEEQYRQVIEGARLTKLTNDLVSGYNRRTSNTTLRVLASRAGCSVGQAHHLLRAWGKSQDASVRRAVHDFTSWHA